MEEKTEGKIKKKKKEKYCDIQCSLLFPSQELVQYFCFITLP